MNKLNLTEKRVGQITIRKFLELYQQYKNTFDLELYFKTNKITYAQFEEKSIEDEEWF